MAVVVAVVGDSFLGEQSDFHSLPPPLHLPAGGQLGGWLQRKATSQIVVSHCWNGT